MISAEQLEILQDIIGNTDRLDKWTIKLDHVSRDVTIVYVAAQRDWFRELAEAEAELERVRRLGGGL